MIDVSTTAAYRGIHFVHFVLAATWLGAAAAADAKLGQIEAASDEPARRAAWRHVRRLTVGVEMPAVGLLLALGLMLAGMHVTLFREPWFHAKLGAVVLLVISFVLVSVSQRRLGEALDDGSASRRTAERRRIRLYRVIAILSAVLLIASVTFRFGADAGAASEAEAPTATSSGTRAP